MSVLAQIKENKTLTGKSTKHASFSQPDRQTNARAKPANGKTGTR